MQSNNSQHILIFFLFGDAIKAHPSFSVRVFPLLQLCSSSLPFSSPIFQLLRCVPCWAEGQRLLVPCCLCCQHNFCLPLPGQLPNPSQRAAAPPAPALSVTQVPFPSGLSYLCTYSIIIFLLFLQFDKIIWGLPPIPPSSTTAAPIPSLQPEEPNHQAWAFPDILCFPCMEMTPVLPWESFTQPLSLSLPPPVYTNSRHVPVSLPALDKLLWGGRRLVGQDLVLTKPF